jgi:hypothetical protein
LKEQEQEAWDEQVEKYHEREAAAFGAHRGPVPGPGNPTGQEGGQQGGGSQQGQQGGEQGSGQGGQDGDGESDGGTEGTYQPYQPGSNGSEDEVSTAGVSESALDFLRGKQGQQQPPPQGAQEQAADAQQARAEASEKNPEQAQAEPQQESSEAVDRDTRGIIAIEDLDKLEGTEIPDDPDQQQ